MMKMFQNLTMAMLVVSVTDALEVADLHGRANTAANSDIPSPFLRGRHHYSPNDTRRRKLKKPKHTSGSDSSSSSSSSSSSGSYKGCLGYSDSELSEMSWTFSGTAPSCSWVHTYDNEESNSSSGSDGSGNSGSSNGSYGDDTTNDNGSVSSSNNVDGDGNYDGDDDKGADSRNGDGNGDDNTNEDDYGNGGGDDEDDSEYQVEEEIVVSNEDVNGGDSEYNPINDFDIEVCDTFENLWLWDLALSCDSEDVSVTGGCSCTFAEELLSGGLLECSDASFCSNNCTVCAACLELLGCGTSGPAWRNLSAKSALYALGAAAAMLLFGLVAHYSRKKWKESKDENSLDQNLLDGKTKNGTENHVMYLQGSDRDWKPLPSDEEYAASQQLQSTSTMSTTSTGRSTKLRRGSRRRGYQSFVGEQEDESDEFEDEDDSRLHGEDVVSSYSTPPPPPPQFSPSLAAAVPSMVEALGSNTDTIVGISPIHTREEDSSSSDGDDPLFEDLSPRSMSTTEEVGAIRAVE